ncbi:MAG: hypothetical protein J0L52_02890 [Caulobacterales bacterium]|nr:hypothetical protein [Caulobacterales bacterium]
MEEARIIRRVVLRDDERVEYHIELRREDGARLRRPGGYITYESALQVARREGLDVIQGWADEYV